MEEYKELKKIFYSNQKSYEVEYQKRLDAPTCYRTGFEIHMHKSEEKYGLFCVVNKAILQKMEHVQSTSRVIQGALELLPKVAKHYLFLTILSNELQSTNDIENVRSTRKEIYEVIDLVKSDSKKDLKTKRFFGLINQYVSKDYELENVEDFRKIYDETVANEISGSDKLDGRLFRKSSVAVRTGLDKILHQGVTPEELIIEKLNHLIWFRDFNDLPKLVKSCIQHYMFEYIHPYYDGNGRVGRLLLHQDLKELLDEFSAITFSYAINRNKNKYYKAFESVSHVLNRGEISLFVEEMLSLIEEGQAFLIDKLHKSVFQWNKVEEFILKSEFTLLERKVLDLLCQSKLFADFNKIHVREIQNMIGKKSKVKEVLNHFEEKKIISKISNRPVIYEITDEYMENIILKSKDTN